MALYLNGQNNDNLTVPKDKSMSISVVGMNRCSATAAEGSDDDIKRIASNFEWRADLDLLSIKVASELSTGLPTSSQQSYAIMLEQTAFYYMGWSLSKISSEDLTGMEPHFKKMYARMEKFVKDAEENKLCFPTALWLAVDGSEKATLRHRMRDSGPEGYLMCLMGRNIPFILKKEVDPVELLIGDNSLKAYFKGTPRIVRTYDAATKYLVLLARKNPHLSILEIGAGTAGATLPILKSLSDADTDTPYFRKYDFTDVNGSLLDSTGEKVATWKRAARWRQRVAFKKLEIENDPIAQGYT